MKKSTKKHLVAAIVAGLTLATAAPAFAAANPFSDVPAKHWAYDSVSKLAAAGIVDGYGDGTFRGDRTMTRYEMAQIVAKAMAHEDRANAEQKAMIDRLAKEFGSELDNLGVRVSNLENKVGNIKWTGQVREWYQWRDEPVSAAEADNGVKKTGLQTRLLLFMEAPLTHEITFKGRLWAESGWGEESPWGTGTGADASMDQAYLTGTHGHTTWTLGRQPIVLGKGLIYAWFPNNDGATLTFGNDKTKLTLAAFRNQLIFTNASDADVNILAANVTHQASKDLDLTLAYARNRKSDLIDVTGVDENIIQTWALGLGYKGIDNVAITAEYGQNSSDYTKDYRAGFGEDHSSAKAWVTQAKYKGAEWTKPHSWGVWVGYRHAEPGFFGRNGDYIWETATNLPSDMGYMMDNVKGPDFGLDYTVFNNAIFTVQYQDLKDEVTGDVNKKNVVAQLRYMF